MGVKFTICGVSTGVLTFPKSVFSGKVVYQIIRRGDIICSLNVVFRSTGSNTGAQAAKHIRHEFVTGWVITREEDKSFRCCENG